MKARWRAPCQVAISWTCCCGCDARRLHALFSPTTRGISSAAPGSEAPPACATSVAHELATIPPTTGTRFMGLNSTTCCQASRGASQGSTRAELMMPTMGRSPRRCHPSSENPTSFWNGSLSACRRLAGNRASAAGAAGADACRMASGHVPSSTTPAPGQEEETRRPRSHSESTSHCGRLGWWCGRLFFWAPPLRPRSAAASSKRPSSVEPRRRRGQGGDKTRDIAGVLPSPRPAADAPNGTHPRG